MFKKIVVAVMGLVCGSAMSARAAGYYTTTIANETGLAQNQTYVLNVATTPNVQQGMSRVAAQVIYSSFTGVTSTFSGGQESTATITVVTNTGLAGVKATDKITVPATSLILASPATAQITISSSVPKAVVTINGNQLREGIEWVGVGVSSQTAATNLAAAINTYLASTLIATAPVNSTVVYATATTSGLLGNAYTLTSSTPSAISTGTLSAPFNGGRNPALYGQSISFNGDKVFNGYLWSDASGTSTGTAASIATWLNSYGVIQATATGSVVYATATVEGVAGNAFTLSASTTNLVVNSANFTGGQDTATITINGVILTAGTQGTNSWAIGANGNQTAINISSAIVNSPSLKTIIVSTTVGSGSVVYATSTAVGVATNYTAVSSTPSALTISNSAFFGGKDAAFTKGLATITIPSHGYSTGYALVYSTGSNVALSPLTWGTTYFAIRVDGNTIALATSNANAVAGSSITFTSSSTLTTAPTYTLTPQGNAGTVSWKWQFSNDGSSWLDYTTPATYTIGAYVFPSTSTAVDFGDVDYQQIRLNVTAPTGGGLGLKAIINGRTQP